MSEELKNQKISITEKAASRLKNIIENEETDTKGIRVTIDTGGCSGMSYKITFESEKQEFDKVFDSHGISIFCDVKSWIYVRGCEIDFSTDLLNGGFKVNNPNRDLISSSLEQRQKHLLKSMKLCLIFLDSIFCTNESHICMKFLCLIFLTRSWPVQT